MMILIELGMSVLLITVVVAALDEAMRGRIWRRTSLANTPSATAIGAEDAAARADDPAA